jgi:putative DNA primase/helicase
MISDAIERFHAAMSDAGIVPPDEIIADGKLRRFSTNGKRGDDAGWYIFHNDGIPAGAFGDWRTGIEQTWRADIGRKLSPVEVDALRRKADADHKQRDAGKQRRQVETRKRAAEIWQAAQLAPADHPYLARKAIKPYGLRVQDGRIVVPLRRGAELRSLQFISADGEKSFLPGGQVAGCYFSIGKPDGLICVAEGYATGASVHESTGHAVAVAFSAANLEPVALALREKYPELPIIVCADDDYRTPGNPGLTKATEAARAVGGLLAVPDFGANRPENATDFNNLAQHAGGDVVKRAVANARAPGVSGGHHATGNATAADLSGPVVEIVRADTIKPEAVEWVWDGYIARGMLHLVAGAPGTGKTTLALACAATVSSAGRWPDGSRAAAGDVLIWSGEDAPANTLVPRLIAMGANLSRVHIVRGVNADSERRWFDPARDFADLVLEAVRLPELRLMIVDPIVSAVAGDSHKNSETRRGLQPLVEFAEQARCAVRRDALSESVVRARSNRARCRVNRLRRRGADHHGHRKTARGQRRRPRIRARQIQCWP